jgi:ElaB/YqjD/DUF883 family membrane-anchored ribosome-binding protein
LRPEGTDNFFRKSLFGVFFTGAAHPSSLNTISWKIESRSGKFKRGVLWCRQRKLPTKCSNQKKEKVMTTPTRTGHDEMNQLAEDARALMDATADVAGEKVSEARKRLAAMLESGKVIAGKVREQAVAGAKAADATIREKPYQAIAVAAALGLIIGYLVGRNRD